MTIRQQIAYIMEHPYFQVAMTDPSAMEDLLFQVHFHMYTTCCANAGRAFRMNRRKNFPEISEAIRDMEPPCNLDIRLPVPLPDAGSGSGCLVVELKNPAEPVKDCGSVVSSVSVREA